MWVTGSPTMPRSASTGPGTPTPIPAIERADVPALEVTSAMRPTIVSSGSRSPARVGAPASTITSPSRVTRPTAVVGPPTSPPTVAPRRFEHHLGDGRQETDVMVGVEMGRPAPHQGRELLDLGVHLPLDVPRVGSRRCVAVVADEAAVGIDERAPTGERPAEREIDVNADTQTGIAERRQLLGIDRRGGEQGRAGDDAVAVRRQDTGADPGRKTEVVGVDDEPAGHLGAVPWITSRSTVSGIPEGIVASRSWTRMCSSR